MKLKGSWIAAGLAIVFFVGAGIVWLTVAVVGAHRGEARFAFDAALLGLVLLAAGVVLAVLFRRPDPG